MIPTIHEGNNGFLSLVPYKFAGMRMVPALRYSGQDRNLQLNPSAASLGEWSPPRIEGCSVLTAYGVDATVAWGAKKSSATAPTPTCSEPPDINSSILQ